MLERDTQDFESLLKPHALQPVARVALHPTDEDSCPYQLSCLQSAGSQDAVAAVSCVILVTQTLVSLTSNSWTSHILLVLLETSLFGETGLAIHTTVLWCRLGLGLPSA